MNQTEFGVLRQTIAARGTVRIVIVPLTIAAWAAMTLAVLVLAQLPVAALLSLAVLAAGFEAVHALHVGVERIGRYIQVFYEERGDEARWETTAMQAGPGLPGGGVDPLFAVLFLSAAVINLLPALLPEPTGPELAVVGALHAAFVARVVAARRAAARQRTVELDRYRDLLLRERDRQ